MGTANAGDPLVVAGEGEWTINLVTGAITFTPAEGFTGDPTPIQYTVQDGEGNTSNAATVTVEYDQFAPVANDDQKLSQPAGAVTLNVTDNDTDANNDLDVSTVDLDPSTAGIQTSYVVAGQGEWTVDALGNVTFTPESGFTLDPTPISYTVNDATGLTSNEATITIDYVPVASNDSSTGNTTGEAVTVDVLANDVTGDAVDPTTVQIVGTANAGDPLVVAGEGEWTINLVTGAITFTPAEGFTGDPTPIQYTVQDGEGNTSNAATVTVEYDQFAPVANDDQKLSQPAGAVTLNVTDNDTDANNDLDVSTVDLDPSTAGIQTSYVVAGQGEWTVDALGNVTFTPESGFTLDPTPISYTVNDATGLTSNEATITIDYVPVASNDSSTGNLPETSVILDVLSNDNLGDNVDPTTVQIVGTLNPGDALVVPGEGEWTVNPTTGAITFTPEIGYSFNPTPIRYTVNDGQGNVSNEALVTITYDQKNELLISKEADVSTYDAEGQEINYKIVVTNSGNVTLTNISVVDPLTNLDIVINSLAPNSSEIINTNYLVKQSDVDFGKIDNTAIASYAYNNEEYSVSDSETVNALQRPNISIEKTLLSNDDAEGGFLDYQIKVVNTGNVTLYDIYVEDLKAGFNAIIPELAPNGEEVFDVSVTITQDMIDDKCFINTATAEVREYSGNENPDQNGSGEYEVILSANDEIEACFTQSPSMSLEKDGVFVDENEDGQAQVGETISYTFKVTNTGNVTLSNIVLEDDKVTVSGGPITSLAPGASDATTFTASYVLTQEDIDAGKVLNLAVARGEAPGGDPNDPSDDVTAESTDPTPVSADERDPECPTCTVTILPREASMSLEKDGVFVDENEDGQAQVGETISYTFKVTNTGNVTLSNIVLEDDKVTVSGGPITSLAPGASDATTFTASYVLTQEDIDAGKVLNLAVARGEAPGGDPNDPSDDVTAESTDPTPVSADERDPECPTCTVTILPREASMSLEKDGVFVDENEDGQAQVGETISYTFKVTNTGNVTLSNIVLEDDKVTVSGGPITSLAPGASDATTFTASYVLTQEDIDAGKVLNLAVARGEAPGGDPNDPSDDVTAESTDPTFR
nr:Ig-like domain-containing protein [Algoriphagus sp. NBT04N3]